MKDLYTKVKNKFQTVLQKFTNKRYKKNKQDVFESGQIVYEQNIAVML